MKCPKCGSGHIDAVDVLGTKYLICLSCGYDESVDVATDEKGRKEKITPYKTGGSHRSWKNLASTDCTELRLSVGSYLKLVSFDARKQATTCFLHINEVVSLFIVHSA